MVRNMFFLVLLYLVLGSFIYVAFLYKSTTVEDLADITYYSSDSLGVSCTGNEDPKGLSIEILNYIFEKDGLGKPKVKNSLRNEALQKTLESKTSSALAVSRSVELEYLFKWVGPIFESYRYIYILDENYEKLKGDITKLDYIVVKGSFDEYLLTDNLIPKNNITYAKDTDEAINLVINGEKDAFVISEDSCSTLMRKQKYKGLKLRKLHNLGLVYYYFAFNKEVPNNVIIDAQKRVDEFKKTDEYLKYVKQSNN